MIGTYQFAGATTLGSRTGSYAVRDTVLTPSAGLHGQLATTRPLNVWAVLADWIAAGDARVTETCELRDYPRLVLTRASGKEGERLYVDMKSGYPVALERREPNYLWGQVDVQYVYATWTRIGSGHLPGTATRMVDGQPELTRTFGTMALVPRDSAPPLVLPPVTAPMATAGPTFLAPQPPDTIRVSNTTFLLRNSGYQEALTLAHDTVFVFDATQGDGRARQDSAWIGKLFPGKHPIAVVVTDLAWPHVAGVRYWVANGATIISHRASRPFLERVVQRRWTDAPDALEKRRLAGKGHGPTMVFRPVTDSLRLAGGSVTLYPIDGAASEGALAAYVKADGFLWASDYIQDLSAPTQYVDEVAAAVRRVGISPVRVAAEHTPLGPWAAVAKLAAP
jgi:hypothetical protein